MPLPEIDVAAAMAELDNHSDEEKEDILFDLYRRSPLAWIKQQVKTLDEHAPKGAQKYLPFPVKEKPYLEKLIALWDEYLLWFVGKSRQIMITWFCLVMFLHEAQFYPGSYFYFQSDKEDLAKKLIVRGDVIWKHQESWLKNRCPMKASALELTFAHGSQIVGIPHGADQIRSQTITGGFMDEACTMGEFDGSFTAFMPSVDVGGRLVVVSSAKPSPYWHRFQRTGPYKNEIGVVKEFDVCKGIKAKLRTDDFLGIRIHYSCDPAKDPDTPEGRTWRDAVRRRMGKKEFAQEYEMNAYALGGEQIYPEFSEAIHTCKPFEIPPNWTRYMCIDPGYRNPTAALWLAVSPEGDLYVYREYYQTRKIVKDHAEAILNIFEKGEPIFIRLIDPAANQKNPVTGTNVRDEYADCGIYCYDSNNDVMAGINAVNACLHYETKENGEQEGPILHIFRNLTNTIEEIVHYQFEEQSPNSAERRDPSEKPRKKGDHLMDCLRYIIMHKPHFVSAVKLPKSYYTPRPGPRNRR